MTQNLPKASLGVVSLGLAIGIAWAFGVFLLGLMAGVFDWGVPVVAVLSSVYVGYSPSFVGSVTGAVWGFVDGFIGGVVIAWLYNRFASRGGAAPPDAD
jgi:hypothetical protein